MNRLGKYLPKSTQDRIHLWRVAARDRYRVARAKALGPPKVGGRGDVRNARPHVFVPAAYQIMLRRDADPAGLKNYVDHLERGSLDANGVLDELLTSMDMRNVPYRNLLRSQHQSRCDFVRMLPRARRILDLGGTDQGSDDGALVSMGYPYPFERLVIIDLPGDERHELYGNLASSDTVQTRLGPVEYRYHSMVDLSQYEDDSFDLVFSGETIEHITEEEARKMLAEVQRVLAPGGWFCVDTPNLRATQLMMPPGVLSNPDHKLEYTAAQLAALLQDAGFTVTGAFGLNHYGDLFERGVYDEATVAANHGVYSDPENCQLLAYIARSPQRVH